MHLASNPCEPQRLLVEASAMAYEKFSTEISFLKTYIDCCAVGTRVIHLRRFLENDVKGLILFSFGVTLFAAVYLIYLS